MHNRLLHKVALVLDAVVEHRALGLEELHLLLDLPKPTLMRLLGDLEELGWLYRRLGDRRYVPLADIGGPADPGNRLAKVTGPFLNELFDMTGMASDLVVATPFGPSILESNYSRLGIRTGQDRIIGARPCPLGAASGRALAAGIGLDAIEAWDGEPDDHQLHGLDRERRDGHFRRRPGNWEYHFRRPFDVDAIAITLPIGHQTCVAVNLYWDARRLPFRAVETIHLPRLKTVGRRLASALEGHITTLETLSTGDIRRPGA
ncbi:helix-turn-helix domain-containing protein [Halomonas ramblicola]|uniref:helix-turn-helix domain-containing protein n=1 Tax=Halomonas ramblicola TaxID=747349 RepID=UPI0025B3A230|nr:helix-turn-helix domain-containing protein [Halomonas ramblicola]MDN3523017.1 helix-turn-helix domain-containing protein [Halomonas ramblicola]